MLSEGNNINDKYHISFNDVFKIGKFNMIFQNEKVYIYS